LGGHPTIFPTTKNNKGAIMSIIREVISKKVRRSMIVLLLVLISGSCSNNNEDVDQTDDTESSSDSDSNDTDTDSGSTDANSVYANTTMTYGEITPEDFPILSEDWRITGIEALRCLLWNYDSETRVLVVDWINESAPSTHLEWQIMTDDSASITSFVIFKDDAECSENSGLLYNWRIESTLEDSAEGGMFDVSIRNCLANDYEIARTVPVSPVDVPRGAICQHFDDFEVFPMNTTGCGTQEGFCRSTNNVTFAADCTVSDQVCEVGLECFSDRCLSPCETVDDCADEVIYDCQNSVCVLRQN